MSILKHPRDKCGDFQSRVLLHIPVGFLIGVAFPLSYPILQLLIQYERNEDAHTQDEAWKDYFGAIVGSALGLAVLLTVVIFILVKGGLL